MAPLLLLFVALLGLSSAPIAASRKRVVTRKAIPSMGNPIDDCWMGQRSWGGNNRRLLANCAQGYGAGARGGADGGEYYVVTSTDDNPKDPQPGTLRYGATRDKPLWITFAGDMTFNLKAELYVNSFKTIDARGANILMTGPCITLQDVSNVIIHGIRFFKCARRLGSAVIRISETKTAQKGDSAGDAITVISTHKLWVDHCYFEQTLIQVDDKFIVVKEGSTDVTISNNFFVNQNKVILLGHSDTSTIDGNLRVTVMLNYFGKNLIQRMPRCRFGRFHVLNNYYPNGWGKVGETYGYAVGGTSAPTILSEGNYYVAGIDKEVTSRIEAKPGSYGGWNWKSRNDFFGNGAFFVPSGSQPALVPAYKYTAIRATAVPAATSRAGPITFLITSRS